MADLSVTAQIHVPHPPRVAYQQFLDGDLLDLECTRMVVGAAVSVSLPVGGAAGEPITLLGHVAAVRSGKSVAVVHHQPWRGRLPLRFHPDGSGTRLVLESAWRGWRTNAVTAHPNPYVRTDTESVCW